MLYPLSYEGGPRSAGAPGEIFSRIESMPGAARVSLAPMSPRTVHVVRELSFAAARSLPHVWGGRTSPHPYRVALTVAGELDARGLVMDWAELDRLAAPALDLLDGGDLVELLGTPSAEVIAVWLLDQLEPVVPGLVSVQVWETDRASAVVHAS